MKQKIKYLEITSFDGLFFGKGLSSNMGEVHELTGIYPPNPSTFYGLIRNIYLYAINIDFEQLNTDSDVTKNIKIRGIFIKTEGESEKFYLPIPLDVVFLNDNSNNLKPLFLKNQDCNDFIMSNDFNSIMSNNHGVAINKKDIYSNIETYLECKDLFSLEENTSKEERIGIKILKETRSAQEHHLYSYVINKPINYKFLIAYEFDHDLLINNSKQTINSGNLKFGGESKPIHYQIKDGLLDNHFIIKEKVVKTFKVILLTPTILKKGWIPDFINLDQINEFYSCPFFNNHPVKLKTVVLGKESIIGGFDIKNKRSKEKFISVPAGSVYYFEAKDTILLNEGIQINYFCDYKEYSFQGYGIFYISFNV